tara:strand:- start:5294 stop:6061 length:768 start_codon:yes stop_codon:yes gene_type:complete
MNEGNTVPSNEQFGGTNLNQQPVSQGMNVEQFLSDVDDANSYSDKNNRVKVDLKEVTFNPKKGKLPEEGIDIRIVPPLEGKAYQKIDFHWNIGTSKMVVCPSLYGRPCPICEYLDGQPDSDDKKKKLAKTRHFLPVIIRGKEHEGPKWWGFSKTVLNTIAGFYKNKYYGDISHVHQGNDINITFPKDSDTPNLMPIPVKSPLMVDEHGLQDDEKINTLRSLVKPLNDVFIELPYDAIQKILDKSITVVNASDSEV